MKTTKTIPLELANWNGSKPIGETAVVGDSGTRALVFALMNEGAPWAVPEGVRAGLAFTTTRGYRGEYDVLPDGTDAFAIEGSRVTIRLIDQVMAEPGTVTLMLVLRDETLGRMACQPVLMEVTAGIEDAEELPKEYYHVRDLAQINRELLRLSETLERIDPDAVAEDARTAQEAAEAAKGYAEAIDPEGLNEAIARKADDVYLEDGRLYLLSEGVLLGEGVELPEGGDGLAFDSGYVDEENRLHLTLGGVDIEGFEPFQIPAESGSSSVMKLSTSLASREFSVLDTEDVCNLPFAWSSAMDGESTGMGYLEVSVGGSRVVLAAVEQGEGSFDIRPWLTAGENAVTLKITDVYGTFRSMSFTVTLVSYGLSWNLGETGVYGSMGMNLRLTPTGSGTKTVKVAVDGTVVSETTVATTGRTTTVTVPAQNHGAHTITAWVEAAVEGETLTTEPLKHTGIWISGGVTTPVVAVLTKAVTVGQYGTAAIRWFVVDPAAETATVYLKVGQETVKVLENVDRSVQTWSYKASQVGEFDLSIVCGSGSGSAKLTVEGLGYEIAPVTEGLVLDLDPAGHSNSEAGRENFGYTDGDGVSYALTFSDNFDWVGGGFQTDGEGVTALVVKRGTSVTLDRGLFDEDCRSTGRTIKLIFKCDNVRNYDAELMSCKSGNVGITVNAQRTTVSSQLETMTVPYYEGRKIEMDICIDSENETAMAWIDLRGVQSCPPIRYGSTDSWAQGASVPLTIGSEDADVWVYRLKLYDIGLNRFERQANFIADCGDPALMAERYERSDIYNDDGSISISKVAAANPGLRVIHIQAERMTTGKSDEVTADLEMLYGEGGEKHHLIAQGVTFKAQGTSSLEYILAALNLDVDFSAATSWVNGLGEAVTEYAMTDGSIPVSYFNLKANVASSESANNVCLADEYNTFNPYVCAPKAADSRVRDTVEGHPCAVFFTCTAEAAIEVGARTVQPGETILYFVGDMNNSKKNFAVFGQDNSVYPKQCCVEVMNNTELPCRFMEEIGDDETWDGGNFEFRFPETPTDEMKAAFTAMQRWVVSTDRDAATGEAFDVPVTYDGTVYAGDTAQFRAAKFRAEFADYFVPEAMDFHYLFTDENCMTDNRAKNLFFCYEYVEELEDYRWSVRCDYDNDTALGNDNSGGLTFTYGLEDTDMVGDSWVYNAHDSVLWCNIRDLRSQELAELHAVLAGQGAWDPDRRSEKFRTYQDAVCTALRSEDMHNKYFLPWLSCDAAAYAAKCCGTKEDQRDQFLYYQQRYKASQYIDVSNRSDAISMRVTVDTAANGDMTITTYSDMYIVVMYGNGGTVKVRCKRNTPTHIECPTDSLGDTETYIFTASNITAISSLAGMKPKFVLATTAKRLQELIVGSGDVGYQNLNLNQIGVGSNQMLRLLDIRSCPNLVTALDLSGLTSLERFYAAGSGITGVTFAKGCPVEEISLPAVGSLVALELAAVTDFIMDTSELTLLRLENCPGIDSLAVCKGAGKLARGRITGADWTDTDASVLVRLAGLSGYDGQGKPTDRFVLTGSAYVAQITQEEIDTITAAFAELALSYGEIVPSVTVTFADEDGTVLTKKDGEPAVFTIRQGGDVENPITAGYMDTPTKASTVEQHFTFRNWDTALTGITEDTTIRAVYAASDRFYTVTHWLDASHSTKLQVKSVIAHGSITGPENLEDPDGKLWMGWDADTSDIVADMDVHAVFITPVLPESMAAEFDYLYSEDPADSSALTLAEFAGVLEFGAARTYFQPGDKIKLVTSTDAFADSTIELMVLGFNHFPCADGSGMAGVVFGMVGLMNAKRQMHSDINAGGWSASDMRVFLNETVFPALNLKWKRLIKSVEVRSSAGETKADILTSNDRLFLLSAAEVGIHTETPYCDEVDELAKEQTFSVFTDNASRVKKFYNGGGTADKWWLRSPHASSDTGFCLLQGSGAHETAAAYMSANYAQGISWACCMGVASE